ncbi:MAG: flagellar hook-length control protein FliK [Pseudomonadota bacterium]
MTEILPQMPATQRTGPPPRLGDPELPETPAGEAADFRAEMSPDAPPRSPSSRADTTAEETVPPLQTEAAEPGPQPPTLSVTGAETPAILDPTGPAAPPVSPAPLAVDEPDSPAPVRLGQASASPVGRTDGVAPRQTMSTPQPAPQEAQPIPPPDASQGAARPAPPIDADGPITTAQTSPPTAQPLPGMGLPAGRGVLVTSAPAGPKTPSDPAAGDARAPERPRPAAALGVTMVAAAPETETTAPTGIPPRAGGSQTPPLTDGLGTGSPGVGQTLGDPLEDVADPPWARTDAPQTRAEPSAGSAITAPNPGTIRAAAPDGLTVTPVALDTAAPPDPALDDPLAAPLGPSPAGTAGPGAPQATGLTPALTAQGAAQQLAAALPRESGLVLTDTATEIALDPPELGRVRVVVTEVAGGLSLTVSAERPETLDLFRRHAALLGAEFAREGLADARFEFSGNDRGGGQRDADADPAPAGDTPDTPDTNFSVAPTRIAAGGTLDLRL